MITRPNAAPSLSMVLNLRAGARGLLQTAASYERVSTFCNRKCDHGVHPATDAKVKKKMLWGGWNVMWTVGFNHWTPQGCYRLPSMLLKAKGSLRPGCAVIRLIEWATTISSGTSRGSEFVKVNLNSGTSGRRVQRTTRNIQITQSAPDTRKDGVSRGEKKYLNRCA